MTYRHRWLRCCWSRDVACDWTAPCRRTLAVAADPSLTPCVSAGMLADEVHAEHLKLCPLAVDYSSNSRHQFPPSRMGPTIPDPLKKPRILALLGNEHSIRRLLFGGLTGGLPGRNMPEAMASKMRLKASPGPIGCPALLITFSTSSSIAWERTKHS